MLSRVSPFRDPRITGYVLLPVAYRSLSRLSSALSAKASTLCPFLLDLVCNQPSVAVAAFSLISSLLRILDEIELFSSLIFDVGMQFSRCNVRTLPCPSLYIPSPSGVETFVRLRQPPTLPRRLQRSTIGRPGLNRRVRYGNGCVPRPHCHRRSVVPPWHVQPLRVCSISLRFISLTQGSHAGISVDDIEQAHVLSSRYLRVRALAPEQCIQPLLFLLERR